MAPSWSSCTDRPALWARPTSSEVCSLGAPASAGAVSMTTAPWAVPSMATGSWPSGTWPSSSARMLSVMIPTERFSSSVRNFADSQRTR